MGTEVAVESDSRDRDCREHQWMPFFFLFLDLCAAPLFECVRDVSGEGSPSSPVMSTGLKLLEVNFCMAYDGLYAVFGGARGSGDSWLWLW